ncbi:MAG: chromate efflux transporter [Elusimicrobia bacterium]|nr:chromate efflux transporter [Elusimicrobiota bacterium]
MIHANLSRTTRYFLWLGATGFGGPIALVNAMERDLVERDKIISPEDFRLGMALAQATPGPLAGQMAMWIGYLEGGARGALMSSLAFLAAPFAMVIVLAWAYVRYGGLPWIQAVFQGVNPAVLAVIFHAAWRLIPRTLQRTKILWVIFVLMAFLTVLTKTELALGFLLSGLVVMMVMAPPKGAWRFLGFGSFLWGSAFISGKAPALAKIFTFFFKTGSMVFGTGFVIVPFMRQGLVFDLHWLGERQFLDAVAVSMITPGPILITVGFIGYLVKGFSGSLAACAGIFSPVYLITVFCAPYVSRLTRQPQVMAFVNGVTAAAVGSLLGTALAMAPQSLGGVAGAGIFAVSVLAIFLWRVSSVAVVAASALVGFLIF